MQISKTREALIASLERYVPVNEQEECDRSYILEKLRTVDNIFSRENTTEHMTCSAWVTNRAHDRIILAYHNIYKSFTWLGGHADEVEELLSVALREVCEECGATKLRVVSPEPISVEVLTVEGHVKRGRYVNSHLHLNVTYLIEADEEELLRKCEGENSAVGWYRPEEAITLSSEPWFAENIFPKLNARL